MDTPQDLTAIRQERNLLFDFYGPMLTPKQAACFTMRYGEDCSLTEIAQELGISPQAAVDFIKRAAERLERCESQLGLVRKFTQQQAIANRIAAQLEELERQTGPSAAIDSIKAAVAEMMYI